MRIFQLSLPVLLGIFAPCFSLPAADLYVAPSGTLDAPGTRSAPMKTLEQARAAVRDLIDVNDGQPPSGGVTVWLAGGDYIRTDRLLLDKADSGTADAPIVWRAMEGESPRLIGGARVPVDAFGPVTDAATRRRLAPDVAGHVVMADLAALGVSGLKPWPDRSRGFGGPPEVIFNGEAMQLARWPNQGWAHIAEVIDRGVGPLDASKGERERGIRGGTFAYEGDRPQRWLSAPDVWLLGFWCHDWFSECLRVESIDTARKRITLAAPHQYGIGPSSAWNREPRRYYALNLLEELDAPGEWYVDHQRAVLYFYPPRPLKADDKVAVTTLTQPLIELNDVSHVTLRGLTLGPSYGPGVIVRGGHDCLVAGCTVENLADLGVALRGGEHHGVVGCDVRKLGRAGIIASGGDRASLTPARHYIVNNHIHHFARLQKTYAAGIHVYGVGIRAAHNLIHDTPHAGVLYAGNEHLLELNEVHDAALETSDVGVFYTGRDWGSQGNVLRFNFIHDAPSMPGCGTMGVYLDDCDSGDTLYGNVFHRAGRAAFIGGGRNNTVENNLLIDCASAVHLDCRGLRRSKPGSGVKDGWDLLAKIQRFNYQQPPWSKRYPQLVDIMQDEPLLPKYNVVRHNVAVDCGKWLNASEQTREYLDRNTFEDNLVLEDEEAGFVDRAAGDFRLRPDSPVFERLPAFKPIPMDKIGLILDEYRSSLPAASAEVPRR